MHGQNHINFQENSDRNTKQSFSWNAQQNTAIITVLNNVKESLIKATGYT